MVVYAHLFARRNSKKKETNRILLFSRVSHQPPQVNKLIPEYLPEYLRQIDRFLFFGVRGSSAASIYGTYVEDTLGTFARLKTGIYYHSTRDGAMPVFRPYPGWGYACFQAVPGPKSRSYTNRPKQRSWYSFATSDISPKQPAIPCVCQFRRNFLAQQERSSVASPNSRMRNILACAVATWLPHTQGYFSFWSSFGQKDGHIPMPIFLFPPEGGPFGSAQGTYA